MPPLRKPPRTARGVRDIRPSRNLTRHDEQVGDLSEPVDQAQGPEPCPPAAVREPTPIPSSGHEGSLLTQPATAPAHSAQVLEDFSILQDEDVDGIDLVYDDGGAVSSFPATSASMADVPSSESGGRNSASTKKRKRSSTYATRGSGFTAHELKVLLDLLEHWKPIARDEWETVARLHNEACPGVDRTVESLRKKLSRMYKTNMGTGNPHIPPTVERAIRIAESITIRADEAQGDDIPDEAAMLFNSDEEANNDESNQPLAPRPLVAPRTRSKGDGDLLAIAQAAILQEQEQRKFDREQARLLREEDHERREEERRRREEERADEMRRYKRDQEEREREREERRQDREQDRLERAQYREQSLRLLEMLGMAVMGKVKDTTSGSTAEDK